MNPVFIIGSGGFGTSLAVLLDQCGIPVSLYSAFPQELEAIARDGENKKLLPGIPVPKTIKLTPNKEEAKDFPLAVFAVPSGGGAACGQVLCRGTDPRHGDRQRGQGL